jgi:NAD(P)-dependent dehydrogenase (short-subunit alcohol dehydrogenase family)
MDQHLGCKCAFVTPGAPLVTVNQIKGTYFPAREILKRHIESGRKTQLKLLVTTSSAANITMEALSAYQPSKSAQQRLVEFINKGYRDKGVFTVGYHPGPSSFIELLAGLT